MVGAHLRGGDLVSGSRPAGRRIVECELRTERAPGRLLVTAGDTRIIFIEDRQAANPFYHFAFNIPENKIVAAREWQLQRSPLLPIPERNRATGLPADIVD